MKVNTSELWTFQKLRKFLLLICSITVFLNLTENKILGKSFSKSYFLKSFLYYPYRKQFFLYLWILKMWFANKKYSFLNFHKIVIFRNIADLMEFFKFFRSSFKKYLLCYQQYTNKSKSNVCYSNLMNM